MAKFTADSVLDAALDKVATATIMTLCNAQPTTRTEAVTTFKLADVVVDSGDFSKANGDVSGRKLVVAAQTAVPVDTSGTSTHVALCDGSDVLHVTTHTSQALTSGNTTNIGSYDIEFLDVTP
jgi:hypothetical protein